MTIIKDELLEPYFIGKDAYCYTAYEVITPQEKYLDKGKYCLIQFNFVYLHHYQNNNPNEKRFFNSN